MHMIIRNIVYANSESEALSVAKNNFSSLCEGQYPFDYYNTFDEGGTSYWGDRLQPVSHITTTEGRKLLVDGWRNTLRDMRSNLRVIQKLTEGKKTTEIIRDIRKDWLQYHFKAIGDYYGESVWLYDNDGEGIKDRSHLNNVLNKWSTDNHYKHESRAHWHRQYKDLDVYIVPADVHY